MGDSDVSSVVATRKLRFAKLGRPASVTITLGRPRREEQGDWACWFRIQGLGSGEKKQGHGIDPFQALIMALEGIRTELAQHRQHLSWEGGTSGDVGFPRFVPYFFGVTFARKLERHIELEIVRFSREAKRKHDRRTGVARVGRSSEGSDDDASAGRATAAPARGKPRGRS